MGNFCFAILFIFETRRRSMAYECCMKLKLEIESEQKEIDEKSKIRKCKNCSNHYYQFRNFVQLQMISK